jgi:16S rRNA (adenine1518-N6/adenine1519-N6)-dimethyltransferase
MNSRDIRRKYGQNYLTDPAILFEMDEAISPKGFDNFIEIGPGHGALTNQINRENVHIIGIDIDSKNIEFLKKNLLDQLILNLLMKIFLILKYQTLSKNIE